MKADCSSQSFKALMTTQFLGAFNDNVYKLLVSLLALKLWVTETGGSIYISLGGALFVLPFILFSPYAGFLADRWAKPKIIRITKIMEVVVMSFALLCLVFLHKWGLFLALFLMGLQSTLFSPAKYGILPEILEDESLSKGNGYIQFWTFLAIIFGTLVGGQLMVWLGDSPAWMGIILVAIAGLGLVASLWIKPIVAQNTERPFEVNGFKVLFHSIREIRCNKNLFLAIIASAFFWFVGAFFQMNVLLYGKQILSAGDFGISLLLVAMALGIGLGSVVAGIVSEGKVELGLVPLGVLGMIILNLALGLTRESLPLALLFTFGLGLSGGFYIVPLNAFIQKQSPQESRGRFLAANNFISFSAMLLASVFLWLVKDKIGFNAAQLFLVISGLSLLAATLIFNKLPEALVRCLNWVFTHTIYRIRIVGKENIPKEGGALIVCNHVSYADPPLVLGSMERPVRFLMFRPLYESRVLNPIAKTMKAIPVSHKDSREEIAKSLQTAADAIRQGELVCIFAEGGLTRLGQMLPFKKGFERIMQDVEAPIIPAHIDQIWGSIFSYKKGRYFWKIPEELPYPVTLSFGSPMSAQSKAAEVRLAVQELASEAFAKRKGVHKSLHLGFLHQVKKHPFKTCMTDSSGAKFSYAKALASALIYSRLFKNLFAPQNRVGVMLPPSIAAALTNLGLMIAGKIPVNLNFTASEISLSQAKAACEIETVITSRRFITKAKLEETEGMVFLEDLTSGISHSERARLVFTAAVLPAFLIKKFFYQGKSTPQDIATVIFTRGSTGHSKGVMLSHANIASNLQAVYDVFSMKKNDGVVGVLPFFHSFGFTGTLWLPLLAGIKVSYHASPLDAEMIGKLVEANRSTVMMATPAFLQSYIQKCTLEQFQSLRNVFVGAEKLGNDIAQAFEKKFGLLPLEGYGATELSPFVTLNIMDYENKRIKQVGQKAGKIGHPLPGVAVKVVDPKSFENLAPDQDGLLLVKGPNVMQGYLQNPEKTQEVIRDGWYVTGDIANIDEDGFVTLVNRLGRGEVE